MTILAGGRGSDPKRGDAARHRRRIALFRLLGFPSEDQIVARIVKMARASEVALRSWQVKKEDLIQAHHSTGQTIRNRYGLWDEHNPHTDPLDPSGANHPDQFSMRVMERVWEELNGAPIKGTETGRWSHDGVGSAPPRERVCTCGAPTNIHGIEPVHAADCGVWGSGLIKLSERDSQAFVDALTDAPRPTTALREAMREFRATGCAGVGSGDTREDCHACGQPLSLHGEVVAPCPTTPDVLCSPDCQDPEEHGVHRVLEDDDREQVAEGLGAVEELERRSEQLEKIVNRWRRGVYSDRRAMEKVRDVVLGRKA